MTKIWKVTKNVRIVLHVKAPTAVVAEVLAVDAIDNLSVRRQWKEFVDLDREQWATGNAILVEGK